MAAGVPADAAATVGMTSTTTPEAAVLFPVTAAVAVACTSYACPGCSPVRGQEAVAQATLTALSTQSSAPTDAALSRCGGALAQERGVTVTRKGPSVPALGTMLAVEPVGSTPSAGALRQAGHAA